jgi:hypothetical protein
MTTATSPDQYQLVEEVLNLIDCVLKSHQDLEHKITQLLHNIDMELERATDCGPYTEDDLPF